VAQAASGDEDVPLDRDVSSSLTRRRFLTTAVAAGLTLGGGRTALARPEAGAGRRDALGPDQSGRPDRQHAWNASLARDGAGNTLAPRHQRLLLLDLRRQPRTEHARRLEASLSGLEQRYPWGPRGLLFTLAWGPRYFEHRLGVRSPVERPKALSNFELPTLDDYDACLHLACDDERRLEVVTAALLHGRPLAGSDAPTDLRPIFRLRETRTGFVGARLPAAHQDVAGIPAGRPVRADAPLFMGFKSGFGRNQASEDDVTIASGPLAGGTTMHVSRMRLRLASWYDLLDERDRVARMFGPQITPAQVAHFTSDAASHPDKLKQAAERYGVIGHAQSAARARRHGRARILRRDFDTADGGEAGLHFVSLQREIEDFVATRKSMNAANAAYLNPAITDTVNNGINEFIFVTHRANYVVPPRRHRSFPLLPRQHP
jgi:dye decolorizing peroxidase